MVHIHLRPERKIPAVLQKQSAIYVHRLQASGVGQVLLPAGLLFPTVFPPLLLSDWKPPRDLHTMTLVLRLGACAQLVKP